MSDPRLTELIHAEIDGELDAQGRAELARRLLSDPEARAERDELHRVCSALDAVPEVDPPPGLKDNVLAALPRSESLGAAAHEAPRRAWSFAQRWRYAALLAGVIAGGVIVFQTVRGPGPAGAELAGTMAAGVLDKAQLEGPVSGTVELIRDGAGLSLRLDLTASDPVQVLIASDGHELPMDDAAASHAAGLRRTIPLTGITAHGQSLEVTFLLVGRPVSSAQLRLPESP
jgi:hypothetical protein